MNLTVLDPGQHLYKYPKRFSKEKNYRSQSHSCCSPIKFCNTEKIPDFCCINMINEQYEHTSDLKIKTK